MLDKDSRVEFIRTFEVDTALLRNTARILDQRGSPRGLPERIRRVADEWEQQIHYMKTKWEEDFNVPFLE